MPTAEELMSNCILCPRQCHANRLQGQTGFCGMTDELRVARASLHMWEEPCISGASGSGTVFFTGCNLQCIFCQNREIALSGNLGRSLSCRELSDIYLKLQSAGANNINLVTASHFIPQVADSLRMAKANGLTIPVVYNTSSYEEVWALKLLDGLVDIYLPDLKYYSSDLSKELSKAPDYFDKASAAIAEMFRQVGEPHFADFSDQASYDGLSKHNTCDDLSEHDAYDDLHLMKRGMIVRHLILPGQVKDTKKILRFLHETYGDRIYVSLMNQYTPLPGIQTDNPDLKRRVTEEEYERAIDFAQALHMENVFIQEGEVAMESFIPDFHDPSFA